MKSDSGTVKELCNVAVKSTKGFYQTLGHDQEKQLSVVCWSTGHFLLGEVSEREEMKKWNKDR